MMVKVSLCTLMLLGMLAGTVCAEIYTWVDSSGTVNFTEDISQVPKKYLKKVRVRDDMSPAVPDVVENGEETPAGSEDVSPAPAAEKTPAGSQAVPPPPAAEKTPVESSEKKEVLYGDRSGKSWKADFETLRAEIGATDDQIAELNARLGDTSKMSRGDFLGIHSSIKNLKYHRGELEKKLSALNDEASRAGVPAEFR